MPGGLYSCQAKLKMKIGATVGHTHQNQLKHVDQASLKPTTDRSVVMLCCMSAPSLEPSYSK